MHRAVRRASIIVTPLVLAIALAHCVGEDPEVGGGPGDGGGGDTSPPRDDGATTDSASQTDGGADAPACDATPCVRQVTAGGARTCAIIDQGKVMCWGHNLAGACGTGTPVDPGPQLQTITPSSVPTPFFVGITNALVVGTGGSAEGVSCAALTDGTMKCWGSDHFRALGRGGQGRYETENTFPEAGAVLNITNVADIGVGVNHVCAIIKGGSVACWGSDESKQLGIVSDASSYGTPGVLSLPKSFKRIATAFHHNVALASDGKVWTWGDNDLGECARPVSADELPAEVTALPGTYIDVSAGLRHGCALDGQGLVYCWGRGRDGQLGRGGTLDGGDFSDPTPARVAFAAGQIATHISSTDDATYTLLDDGTVWGWGRIPTLPPTIQTTPAKVTLPKRAVQIEAGGAHVCALLEGGELWCWGQNLWGELARPPTDASALDPARVVFP